jgi:hypothetical protein
MPAPIDYAPTRPPTGADTRTALRTFLISLSCLTLLTLLTTAREFNRTFFLAPGGHDADLGEVVVMLFFVALGILNALAAAYLLLAAAWRKPLTYLLILFLILLAPLPALAPAELHNWIATHHHLYFHE